MSLYNPYYKIVPRSEVFGSGDTGTKTVIKLIDNKDVALLPDPEASVSDKQQWDSLKLIVNNEEFTECPLEGYFEFKRKISENDLKGKMESVGFNEYD